MAALVCLLLGYSMHLPVAHAQTDARVLVIPLESSVPGGKANIVAAFNLAMADSLEREASKVTVAQTTLDDTMAIVGCSERSASCLGRVAEALEVDYIVYGTVTPGPNPDTFEVTVMVAKREGDAPPAEHRFAVSATQASEAGGAFAGAAPRALLTPEQESAGSPITVAEQPDTGVTPAPAGDGASAVDSGGGYTFDIQRVERSSWIVTGTGGALFSMGVVFWLLASSSQSDINAVVVDDASDIQRLLDLESRTRFRANVGNALVVTGTMTAIVGAVLAARQGLVREEPSSVSVSPMITGTGVGIIFSMGWPD
jgi:hypothetical protein